MIPRDSQSSTDTQLFGGRKAEKLEAESILLEDGDTQHVNFLDGEVKSVMAVNEVSGRLNANFSTGSLSIRTERDNGRVKLDKVNDDGFLVGTTPDGKNYIVLFDGLGSEQGSLATAVAAEVIEEALQQGLSLHNAFLNAHEAVRDKAKVVGKTSTVATGILIDGNDTEIVTAGDADIIIENESGEVKEDQSLCCSAFLFNHTLCIKHFYLVLRP